MHLPNDALDALADFPEECRLAHEKNLPIFVGNILEHAPKEVVALMRAQGQTLYLCRWHQAMESCYLAPSWVPSEFITEIVGQRIIVDFYEKSVTKAYP